jgi:SAM-dependent methyltransferase
VPEQPSHLGGFHAAGDPATWFPDLWTWLVREQGVSSVIDVGCGAGHSLRYFADLGCRVIGVDGVPQDDPRIIEWDYTRGLLHSDDEFDLAWCCEFVEHVPEPYISGFLETFQAARTVLLTHAEPGQPGHHHVNCQPSGYWIDKLERAGFMFDGDLTLETRRQAFRNGFYWVDGPCSETWWGFHLNHYVRSGLAFRRA